jgi:prepilin signal peptidase PulO-like enzyme (type II secretory pathway)
MRYSWVPALVLVVGLSVGPALTAYAAWMMRCRRGEAAGQFSPVHTVSASLVNGFGWLLACLVSHSVPEAANLGLMVSAAVVLTLIDVGIRVIPNELVAALLALAAALALLEKGFAVLPWRLGGFLAALALFLLAMRIAGPGKVGGGDVKLAAAVGFAVGFPNVLVAVLIMALAASATGVVGVKLKKMGKSTPMPFAGFLMAGLVVTMFLNTIGALEFIQ